MIFGPRGRLFEGFHTCVLVSFNTLIAMFLNLYALNNPDKEAWSGQMPNGSYGLFANKHEGEVAGAQDLFDVHERFQNWFLWGCV